MGIRPRGEGEREMVRQYEELGEAAEEGERWPLGAPLGGDVVAGGFLRCGGDCAVFVTMDLGLRLRALARSSAIDEEPVWRLLVEPTIGAK